MREGAAQLSASEERRQAAAGTVRAGTHNQRALEAGARLLRGELCRGRCGGPNGANEQEAKHRGRKAPQRPDEERLACEKQINAILPSAQG